MKDNALIVFMKKPEAGKVKTRLAKTIGNEAAVDIYCRLLDQTKEVVADYNCDVFVFYSPEIIKNDLWDSLKVFKRTQSSGDLGQKMNHAFDLVFQEGYRKVAIIGTDCYELKPKNIEEAFDQLESCNTVFGPSTDGGYYLLGMNRLYSNLFTNIPWSTSEVLQISIEECHKNSISYQLIETLTDIDEWEDLICFPELKNTLIDRHSN